MTGMEIWNNPSCSKCAAARTALDEAGVGYALRPYLDRPPSAAELAEVLRRLDAGPWDVCRTQEPAAVALGMADWPRDEAAEPRWIEAMVAAPELIQRPLLLLDDGSALVGRTAGALAEALRRTAATPGTAAQPGAATPGSGAEPGPAATAPADPPHPAG
ncbi:arsenate reductase family protein [Micromonospora sp. NBC_01740]|uniref:ArsC/Spx/MgsR family protein n=1 Tax=Micromonospora sp. NBC_01740 TaxID=2975986 RepID=UPI002E1684E3|nr:arsenate reductase family protein [Micromonospora sp. NBC_01740]